MRGLGGRGAAQVGVGAPARPGVVVGEEEEQVRVGGARIGGARPPRPHQRGRLALVAGGLRPGTQSPRRGMEAAAAAADVIWSWAEQVMGEGEHDPKGGKSTDGKLNPVGTPELT